MVKCPRCKNTFINSFRIKRVGIYVNIHKCTNCGFLFMEDKDMIELGTKESKKLFIDYIRSLGRDSGTEGDTS
jgi:hypothetical protein